MPQTPSGENDKGFQLNKLRCIFSDEPSKRILWAAENNNHDAVREIVEKDKEMIHSCDQDGYTALHRAAYSGHLAMVEVGRHLC